MARTKDGSRIIRDGEASAESGRPGRAGTARLYSSAVSAEGGDEQVQPFPQESLLIDGLAGISGKRLICTSPGLAQFAGAAARALPRATVSCTYLDLYRANLASNYWSDCPPNLRIECAADVPEGEADVVALPFAANGEAELTRDLIQSGHERLRIGGKMFAATNNPTDSWLGDQLGKVFGKVERRSSSAGVLCVGTKTERLKKLKNFACEFAFRDRGRLIRVFSRPGVFSHRRLDTGARRLIDAMVVEPASRVLDIGCGAGTVSLAAACCGDGAVVHAVDSNVRAIECTQQSAALNGLNNVTTELNADGRVAGAGQYDLALANPPYYSGFQIAEHFLTASHDALRVGGKLIVVTKFPAWYQENMPRWYDDVLIEELKNYHLIQGIRRSGTEAEMQRL